MSLAEDATPDIKLLKKKLDIQSSFLVFYFGVFHCDVSIIFAYKAKI